MSKLAIEDGAVQEDRIYYDYREFTSQLGLTFPEILALVPGLAIAKREEFV